MSETQDIYQVIDALTRVQRKLAITEPEALTVKEAWPFFPPSSTTVAIAAPAWLNEWSLTRVDYGVDMPQEHYSIHMQLLVRHADLNMAARLATAFMPRLALALEQRDAAGDGGVSLARAGVPTVDALRLRGGVPTLARFERSEGVYMGLDLWLDVELSAGVLLS